VKNLFDRQPVAGWVKELFHLQRAHRTIPGTNQRRQHHQQAHDHHQSRLERVELRPNESRATPIETCATGKEEAPGSTCPKTTIDHGED